ncbi:MAG: hypothetical protein JST05_04105 [Acidobacteria bacterium]|nr:hypothetical protein [Acidobacteriota bacterium]
MRRLPPLALIVMLAACGAPSTIQTSASGSLRREIQQDILDAQGMHHPDCPVGQITAARIVQQGDGATQELWTLEGCGKAYLYDVTVRHDEDGAQVSVHEHDASQS